VGSSTAACCIALADWTGGFCAYLNLAEGASGTATIESKTNVFAAVR
jgi:1,4-dihydroxy-2-naphthoyl-CoA hydrolase